MFAIDRSTEEVSVSESPKGSNKVTLVERIKRQENEQLYSAVVTLTLIAQSTDLDPATFKAMDKVCQLMYNKFREAR
jgi:hypothetical protein